MRVVYEGPNRGVWIEPEGVYAARGEHTEVSDELAKRLAKQPTFTVPGLPDDADEPTYPQHLGGGWYETSDGDRVQGEQAAQEHQDSLDQQQEG